VSATQCYAIVRMDDGLVVEVCFGMALAKSACQRWNGYGLHEHTIYVATLTTASEVSP